MIASFRNILSLIFTAVLLESCATDASDSKLCFIGDSITYGWDLRKEFPTYNTIVHAKKGARIQDVLSWDVSDCSGEPTVILMGTNNLGNMSGFLDSYTSALKHINGSRYYIVSILPRNEQNNSQYRKLTEQANANLKKLADEYTGSNVFIDAYPLFLQDGEIQQEYFTDGLHLSESGYDILSNIVRSKL